LYADYSRVAVLFIDSWRQAEGNLSRDTDQLILKSAIHFQDLLLAEDVDVLLRRLRLNYEVNWFI